MPQDTPLYYKKDPITGRKADYSETLIRCTSCGSTDNGVTDSKPAIFAGASAVRRHRKCRDCGFTWFTVEINQINAERLVSPKEVKQKLAVEMMEKLLLEIDP